MKPLAFDLRDSKKISADPHSSTFQLKGGHQIKIAHAPLSALHRKMIERMPIHAFAEGGDSTLPAELSDLPQEGDPGSTPDSNIPLAQQAGSGVRNAAIDAATPFVQGAGAILGTAGKFIKGLSGDTSIPADTSSLPSPTSDLPDAGQPVGTTESRAPSSAAPQSVIPGVSLAGAYQTGVQGINAEQEAQSGLGQQRADADKLYQAKVAAENAQWEDERQAKMMETQNATDDVQNGTINPNHYLENLSVPGKIATAIGMILGGVGSGVTGRSPAMDWINAQIGRDIDAQKSNQENRKTVLGAYQQKYQNAVAAENMTRATQYNIYASKLQQAADQSTDPIAKAHALQAKAQLQQQILPLVNQANLIQRIHQGGGAGIDALDLGRAGIIPPEQATKEQSSVNTANARVQQANHLFDQLDKEQSTGGLVNPQSYARRNQIMAQMTPLVQDEDPSKRLTEESYQKEIAPFIYSTGATPQTRQTARAGVLNLIKTATEGGHPTVSKYLPNSLSYNQQPALTQSSAPRVGEVRQNLKDGTYWQYVDAKGNKRQVSGPHGK